MSIKTIDSNGRAADATLSDLQAISGFSGGSGPDLGSISLTSYSPDNTGATSSNTAFTNAVSACGVGCLVIPKGTYKLDNSTGPIVISNFAGKLKFEQGAVLSFTDNTKMGIQFSYGTGAVIDGLHLTYASNGTTRNSGCVGLFFYQTTDTRLINSSVNGPGGVGIQFQECTRPFSHNIDVTNTMADGFDYFNCLDATISCLRARNCGDDGLAFVNYGIYQDLNGGVATNIRVDKTNARGITIVGTSNVTVSGFLVTNTTNAGVLCQQDTNISSRVPVNARFSDGIIVGAGTYLPTNSVRFSGTQGGYNGCSGNNVGIQWMLPVGSGSVSFENITVSGCSGNASFDTSSPHRNFPLGVLGAGGERVTLRDLTINGVSGHGIQIGTDPLNYYNNAPGLVMIENVLVEAATGVAFLIANCANVLGSALSALNCGSGLSSPQTGRVLDLQTNAGIGITGLRVVDTQGTATGYAVYENANTRGKIQGIIALLTSGTYSGSYNSSGVTVTP